VLEVKDGLAALRRGVREGREIQDGDGGARKRQRRDHGDGDSEDGDGDRDGDEEEDEGSSDGDSKGQTLAYRNIARATPAQTQETQALALVRAKSKAQTLAHNQALAMIEAQSDAQFSITFDAEKQLNLSLKRKERARVIEHMDGYRGLPSSAWRIVTEDSYLLQLAVEVEGAEVEVVAVGGVGGVGGVGVGGVGVGGGGGVGAAAVGGPGLGGVGGAVGVRDALLQRIGFNDEEDAPYLSAAEVCFNHIPLYYCLLITFFYVILSYCLFILPFYLTYLSAAEVGEVGLLLKPVSVCITIIDTIILHLIL
jgi:hypothetical protein